MRKLLTISLCVAALAMAVSCQKPFVTTIELAVDYSDSLGGMVLRKCSADTCYIHVVSNTDWNAELSFDGDKWATLGKTSGSGQAWVPFYCESNYSGNIRYTKFKVKTTDASKQCEFTISQPTGEQ